MHAVNLKKISAHVCKVLNSAGLACRVLPDYINVWECEY